MKEIQLLALIQLCIKEIQNSNGLCQQQFQNKGYNQRYLNFITTLLTLIIPSNSLSPSHLQKQTEIWLIQCDRNILKKNKQIEKLCKFFSDILYFPYNDTSKQENYNLFQEAYKEIKELIMYEPRRYMVLFKHFPISFFGFHDIIKTYTLTIEIFKEINTALALFDLKKLSRVSSYFQCLLRSFLDFRVYCPLKFIGNKKIVFRKIKVNPKQLAIYQKLKEDDIIHFTNFSSCSENPVDEEVNIYEYNLTLTINIDQSQGTSNIIDRNNIGPLDIQIYSVFISQEEILFPPLYPFKVKRRIQKAQDKHTIELSTNQYVDYQKILEEPSPQIYL